MNCEQCLETGAFLCGPVHALKALANSVSRAWRGVLDTLAQMG